MDRDLYQDMQDCDWFVAKLQERRYAQNVYAALCNMRWQPMDVLPILRDEYWSCTWRSAGDIVADLRGQGEDYMDYYCSGIQDFSSDQADPNFASGGFVAESVVTDEVRQDLESLGWRPSEWPKDAS